jgi:hypothetical protein
MLVILSKEEKRKELGEPDLPYELTDLRVKEEEDLTFEFNFDEEKDIYEKLKNLTATDTDKIVSSEGLPFSYIVNLMKEVSDTFRSYGENFTYQIEKVYNDQFELMTKSHYPEEHEEQELKKRGSAKVSLKVLD